MPGVTFFCIFVRPETNRQGGGNHPPLVGRGYNQKEIDRLLLFYKSNGSDILTIYFLFWQM